MGVLFFLILIGLAVLDWFIAKEFYAIAVKKGHHEKKYFWWCFWCTLYGYLMVVALPDCGSGRPTVEADELPDL